MKHHDISQQRFGRLVTLKKVPPPKPTKSRDAFWLCQCDCGNRYTVRARSLKHDLTRSCGCLNDETRARLLPKYRTKHGHYGSKEYRAWTRMKDRCNNKSHPAYLDYGGRGILVCQQWQDSFKTFLKDVGYAPSPEHSIDRIDNGGNYEPGNVRWATWSIQSRNRRDRKLYTNNGKTMLLVDWSKETKINLATLHSRLTRGWSIERTLTTDPNEYHNRSRFKSE